jgi:hypothetical protein
MPHLRDDSFLALWGTGTDGPRSACNSVVQPEGESSKSCGADGSQSHPTEALPVPRRHTRRASIRILSALSLSDRSRGSGKGESHDSAGLVKGRSESFRSRVSSFLCIGRGDGATDTRAVKQEMQKFETFRATWKDVTSGSRSEDAGSDHASVASDESKVVRWLEPDKVDFRAGGWVSCDEDDKDDYPVGYHPSLRDSVMRGEGPWVKGSGMVRCPTP